MDLYEIESKTMFAVKIGKSSGDLCYAIDQSITALKKYKHKRNYGYASDFTCWFMVYIRKKETFDYTW